MQANRRCYKCRFCTREYKEKYNYDRHVGCCEFFSKSTRERDNEVDMIEILPSHPEMYRLIQELAFRVDKLEKENTKLKQLQKRKMNILEWLNNEATMRNPSLQFSEWITNKVYPHIPDYLEAVYSNDLLHGITELLGNVVENTETDKLPIRAFDTSTNIFYVYRAESDVAIPKWTKMTATDFEKYLMNIAKQFMVEFKNHWYTPNKEKVETDEKYMDLYVNYYQRILGGSRMSDESRCQKIRQNLYTRIKENIKTIVEYDLI